MTDQDAYRADHPPLILNFSGSLAVQLARQLGFWRCAIEVKPFVEHLASDIVVETRSRIDS
jgi:hypothetical protein